MSKRIGLLGGGQLALMTLDHARRLGFKITVLDSIASVAGPRADEHIIGSFRNYDDVLKLSHCDIITAEIEHVNTEAMSELERRGLQVFPRSQTFALIQDKGKQKQFFKQHNLPTSGFEIRELSADENVSSYVLKLCREGYDGKGVYIGDNPPCEFMNTPILLEQKVDIDKELAVQVARNSNGEVSVYPVVEMLFYPKLNLMDSTFTPAAIDQSIANKAHEIALALAEKLDLVGILSVELFLTKSGELLINELAPRPHNSGHYTIEASYCDQFEQFLRAITNLPLGKSDLRESALCFNIVSDFEGEVDVVNLAKYCEDKTYVHLYGKEHARPGRKMGHVTILGSLVDCLAKQKKVREWKLLTKK